MTAVNKSVVRPQSQSLDRSSDPAKVSEKISDPKSQAKHRAQAENGPKIHSKKPPAQTNTAMRPRISASAIIAAHPEVGHTPNNPPGIRSGKLYEVAIFADMEQRKLVPVIGTVNPGGNLELMSKDKDKVIVELKPMSFVDETGKSQKVFSDSKLRGGAASFVVADLNDINTLKALRGFIGTLDVATLANRWAKTFTAEEYDTSDSKAIIMASDKGKVIGFIDHMDSDFLRDAAHINVVVDQDQRGTGLARELAKQQDAMLVGEGYKYKSGFVHSDHPDQMKRLLSGGWKVAEGQDPDEEMLLFWKALDPRLTNKAPDAL
jgi:hypothetical protein